MKDQLQTIRAELPAANNGSFEARDKILTALAQLEAMVGEQKPIWYHKHWGLQDDIFYSANEKVPEGATPLFAGPVAQQPQATCITITHAQAAELMLMFSGAEPDTEITLLTGDGHSGPGLYAYYEEYPEEGAEKLDATELPAQQPQADRERCIEARNALNEALHGPGALIDSLEEAVEAACRKLKQPQAEMHRYSPDGEGGMEVDSLGAWVKLQDVKQPQAEAITEAAIDAYLDDYEMRGETEDGRDACYTPSEREKFLIKDAIMGLLAEIPPKQPQAEAVPPAHVLVPVELLNRVLDSEEVNEMADASDELRAMLAAAKKEAGHE